MSKIKKKIKGTVTVFSNSPGQPTGYGQAADALVKLLKRDGANVAALSNYGHEGINTIYHTPYGEVPIYARGNEAYSNDVAPAHHKHWRALNRNQPDLMITLYDVWVLTSKAFDDIPIASWTPIDHNPVPPGVLKWLQKENVTPLAMSKFGLEQINKAGLEHGWNLMALGQMLGIPADNMTFPDPLAYRYGMPQETLAGIYSSWDVMLATSYGEGFGVPTVEAQACGVPVIVSKFAASPELVGDGWAIGGQPLYDPAQHSFWHVPSVPEIVEALEQAYTRGKGKSAKAVEFAKQYDHEKVWQENWLPLLKAHL
jgi:hypothetical protein